MNVTILSTLLMQLHSLPPTGPPTTPPRPIHYDPVTSISPTRALMGSLVPHQNPPPPVNHSVPGDPTYHPPVHVTSKRIDSPLLFHGQPDAESPSVDVTLRVDLNDTAQTAAATENHIESNTILDVYTGDDLSYTGDTLTTAEPIHYLQHPVPPSYGRDHTHHKPAPTSTREPGPYFRPPGAISKKHRSSNNDDFDPNCFPRCLNYTNSRTSSGSGRTKRKHGEKEKTFYNYKLLYDTIKGSDRRKETEFYAWIFGATMLGLGSLTTLTSCFAFCFCSDRWRKRRKTKSMDQSGDYQRVDSVSSMVSHADSAHADYEPLEPMDDVTII